MPCVQGDNLNSVEASEVSVTVGGEECVKTATNSRGSDIICTAPGDAPNGELNPVVVVKIGTSISVELETRLEYSAGLPLDIIIPASVVGVLLVVAVVVIIMCCIICRYNSKHKKTEQRWTNLLAQMELLEVEMADECKRGKRESGDWTQSYRRFMIILAK